RQGRFRSWKTTSAPRAFFAASAGRRRLGRDALMRIVARLAARQRRAVRAGAFRRAAAACTKVLRLTADPITEDADRPTSVGVCTDRLHAVAVDGMRDRRLVARALRRLHERGVELTLDLLDARGIN